MVTELMPLQLGTSVTPRVMPLILRGRIDAQRSVAADEFEVNEATSKAVSTAL